MCPNFGEYHKEQVLNSVRTSINYNSWNKIWNEFLNLLNNNFVDEERNAIEDFWNLIKLLNFNKYGNIFDHDISNLFSKIKSKINFEIDYRFNPDYNSFGIYQKTYSIPNFLDRFKNIGININIEDDWNDISQIIYNGINENIQLFSFTTSPFSGFNNHFNNDWMIFYDFLNSLGMISYTDDYEIMKQIRIAGIQEMICFNKICIVSELPIKVLKNDQGKLHSSESASVEWADGYGLYFWNGINIPKDWIMNKELITKNDILTLSNIEKRRCLMEIIGTEKFFKLLDIICIDIKIDDCNRPMKLFRSLEKDIKINDYLYYLCVIDPSTEREYTISVPPCN